MKSKQKKPKRRQVRLPDEVVEILKRRRDCFREKFRREPGPTDPIFFDPHADTPRPMEMDTLDEAMLDAMAHAGIDPAIVHAWLRTGLLVSEENRHLISAEDLAEWQAAIEEYQELQRTGGFN